MFKCFQCFVALFHSSAPSPSLLGFEIHDNFSIQFYLDPLFLSSIQPSIHSANNLSLGCVLSQQHLIKRHIMVRRYQSCPKALHSYRSWCSNRQISELQKKKKIIIKKQNNSSIHCQTCVSVCVWDFQQLAYGFIL